MKKRTKIILAAAVAIAALASLKIVAAAPKPPKPQIWTPGCVASVTRSSGTFRGASAQSGLAFEDSAGTLRFLTNIPCEGTPVVSLEIHRTVGNNNGTN
jgi:opacity protein-like surface antigen